MLLRLWLKVQLLLARFGAYVVINGKTSWEFERRYEKRYGKFWSIQWYDRPGHGNDDKPLYGGRK
jgi:hypothetical protein